VREEEQEAKPLTTLIEKMEMKNQGRRFSRVFFLYISVIRSRPRGQADARETAAPAYRATQTAASAVYLPTLPYLPFGYSGSL
jgi:hypothetical protein